MHVAFPENREIIEMMRPECAEDWLLVACDVGERFADIEWALRVLSGRFATAVWAPSNREDYSFQPPGASGKADGLARRAGPARLRQILPATGSPA